MPRVPVVSVTITQVGPGEVPMVSIPKAEYDYLRGRDAMLTELINAGFISEQDIADILLADDGDEAEVIEAGTADVEERYGGDDEEDDDDLERARF